ncbi:hypothetical protein LB505_007855 [Fusarium chuoi]|nr:hypothetical protein LB505_007855 [Fusarium chuoi]
MADPLSIIGTAGAIANIIDVLTKTITTVCDMRQAWKVADLAVFAFENQLSLLKFALFEIQKWTESRSNEQSHQLVMQVDSCRSVAVSENSSWRSRARFQAFISVQDERYGANSADG